METPINRNSVGRNSIFEYRDCSESAGYLSTCFEYLEVVACWRGWLQLSRYVVLAVVAFSIGEWKGEVSGRKIEKKLIEEKLGPVIETTEKLNFDEKAMTAKFHRNYLKLKGMKEYEYSQNNSVNNDQSSRNN